MYKLRLRTHRLLLHHQHRRHRPRRPRQDHRQQLQLLQEALQQLYQCLLLPHLLLRLLLLPLLLPPLHRHLLQHQQQQRHHLHLLLSLHLNKPLFSNLNTLTSTSLAVVVVESYLVAAVNLDVTNKAEVVASMVALAIALSRSTSSRQMLARRPGAQHTRILSRLHMS